MQVFVVGMHRSGTSVVARLLNLMGCYFGPEGSGLPANAENPRGFWERRDVVALNDRLLATQGSTWCDVSPFVQRATERDGLNPVLRDLDAMLLELDAHRPWFLKDPRLSLTLPFWRRTAQQSGVVLCWRNPAAVAASIARRAEDESCALTQVEAYALWEAYLVEALNGSRRAPRCIVDYDSLLADPYAECERLYKWLVHSLGVPARLPAREEVGAFIDAGLNRSAANEDWREIESIAALMERLRQPLSEAVLTLSPWCLSQLETVHRRGSKTPAAAPATGMRLNSAQKTQVETHLATLYQARHGEDAIQWDAESLRAFAASLATQHD